MSPEDKELFVEHVSALVMEMIVATLPLGLKVGKKTVKVAKKVIRKQVKKVRKAAKPPKAAKKHGKKKKISEGQGMMFSVFPSLTSTDKRSDPDPG